MALINCLKADTPVIIVQGDASGMRGRVTQIKYQEEFRELRVLVELDAPSGMWAVLPASYVRIVYDDAVHAEITF